LPAEDPAELSVGVATLEPILAHTGRRLALNKISRVFTLALLVLLTSSGLAFSKHNDDLILKLPLGWIQGNVAEDRRAQSQIMQLIRPGDDIHNWKELLTELSYPRPRPIRKPTEVRAAVF
jgi:hypothetical protein